MDIKSCIETNDLTDFKIEYITQDHDPFGWYHGIPECPFNIWDAAQKELTICWVHGVYKRRKAWLFSRVSNHLVGSEIARDILRQQLEVWCRENYDRINKS